MTAPELFARCFHAGEEIAPNVRGCLSPRILGLPTVTPEDCRFCTLRTETPLPANVPTSRKRLVSCHWLGEPSLAGETYECRHAQHADTTLEHCNRCADYLFPVMSSRMPVEEVLIHRRHPGAVQPKGWWTWKNVHQAQRLLSQEFLDQLPAYPGDESECGIVVVGGGKYLPSAYVTCRVIRHLGCELPIELWHLEGEIAGAESAFDGLNVAFRNADLIKARHPFRFLDENWWKGWQLKAYALLYSGFEKLLLLDADCYPLRNPEFLLECEVFRRHGAVFWPDIPSSRCLLTPKQVAVFGLPPFQDQAAESGQILMNRRASWRELSLAGHHNQQADFTYQILWGDKNTFPIAWKQLGQKYGRLWPSSRSFLEGIYQFDERGQPLFLHRCTGKFVLEGTRFDSTPGQHGAGFNFDLPLEKVCQAALIEFRQKFPRRLDFEERP